jgi:hypothetical protein
MHLILLLLLIPVSIGVRWAWQSSRRAWRDRWKAALSAFLIPPILLIRSGMSDKSFENPFLLIFLIITN